MTRPDYCPVAQEPCQAMCVLSDVRCKIRDTPPAAQRQWVGLTTEEMATCIDEPSWDLILRKAEQILKEKNA